MVWTSAKKLINTVTSYHVISLFFHLILIFSLHCLIIFTYFRYYKTCNIKITYQCKTLIVPEEGWFGQPKYSTPTKKSFYVVSTSTSIFYINKALHLHSPHGRVSVPRLNLRWTVASKTLTSLNAVSFILRVKLFLILSKDIKFEEGEETLTSVNFLFLIRK